EVYPGPPDNHLRRRFSVRLSNILVRVLRRVSGDWMRRRVLRRRPAERGQRTGRSHAGAGAHKPRAPIGLDGVGGFLSAFVSVSMAMLGMTRSRAAVVLASVPTTTIYLGHAWRRDWRPVCGELLISQNQQFATHSTPDPRSRPRPEGWSDPRDI